MSPAITKLSEGLVRPATPTPTGCTLPLSPIDKRAVLMKTMDWIHVFKHGPPAGRPAASAIIKEALAKALVHYYPLAGKLVRDEGGELVVACTGDGAWFVEAAADCSLTQLNCVKGSTTTDEDDLYAPLSKDELLANYPCKQSHLGAILISLQVTQFTCGGFIVGFSFNHVMLDGIGAAQFLKAVGELARGLQQPTVPPIWSRDLIPSLPEITLQPNFEFTLQPNFEYTLQPNSDHLGKGTSSEMLQADPFEFRAIDIPLHHINHIKHQFSVQATAGAKCSTFDVLAAKVWQSRTRALGKDARAMASMVIIANVRQLLGQVLPSTQGYYGNCICTVLVMRPSEQIASAPLVQVIKLIRDEREAVMEEFQSGVKRELREEMVVEMDYMGLVDERKIGLYDVDYGYGAASYSDPWTSFEYIPLCMITQPPAPQQGARLLTHCARKEHIAAFCDQMMEVGV